MVCEEDKTMTRSSKPEGYPLPWCEDLDRPFWWVNLWLCATRSGWRQWQRGKDMREIIPEIDGLVNGDGSVLTSHEAGEGRD